MNERSTEEIVREHLKEFGVPTQRVEEQASSNPLIRRALSAASKSGQGAGKPEFVITFPEDTPDLVLVVECKADPARHESANRDRPDEYSVDGVLHYSAHLARYFDVIAIAVSGTDSRYVRVSAFRQLKGHPQPVPLFSPNGLVERLLPIQSYRDLLTYDPEVVQRTVAEMIAFSRTLHDYMRDYAKLAEAEKPLVVSGVLLALRDTAFKATWPKYGIAHLPTQLCEAIARVARDADIGEQKREIMLAPYAFIETHPELGKPNASGETPLRRIISDIDEHVRPFLDFYQNVDVIGQFYGEFLRYTGGDKKGLGIVLTPRHLTELFADIANVGPDSVVVDTCAGTGGFLISAMRTMDAKVGADATARERIRKHQLIGVEQLPQMFALAMANMILRGDGKVNLYRGSCFDPAIQAQLKNPPTERHPRPTIGLINPPFSQAGDGLHELDFVETLLDILSPGGTAVVVLPMSCAIAPHPTRARILERHTLVAVMSLPSDVFYPIGVVACIMVFTAHQPHAGSPQKSWFGYWKDDGFIKTKHLGRVDLSGRWPGIRQRWLDNYFNRREEPGVSVLRRVGADDEWCSEAYIATDYSTLNQADFEDVVRSFAVFRALQAIGADPARAMANENLVTSDEQSEAASGEPTP